MRRYHVISEYHISDFYDLQFKNNKSIFFLNGRAFYQQAHGLLNLCILPQCLMQIPP